MATEYRSIEYRLHENLVQLEDALLLLGFDTVLLDVIKDAKDLIKSKRYNVAVMGEFKRGKSSLINALLGSQILPADATPTTATVNRITYGAEIKTVITYKDDESEEIPMSDLSEYVTKLTESGQMRAARVKEAVIYYPTVICQNNVDIIDTPGLNDEERMTKITIEMIKHVDAIIVPIHALIPFSETEKNFICQLIESESISSLIFVVTFLDMLDPEDYEYESYMGSIKNRIQTMVFAELENRKNPGELVEKAHRMLDDIDLMAVSSSQALESFITNNKKLREDSRFEEFQKYLLHCVTAQQVKNAIDKTKERVDYIVSQFDTQNLKRLDSFSSQKKDIDEAEQAIKDAANKVKQMLNKLFARDADNLETLAGRFNTVKNYTISEFIKYLSQIKVDTHEEIHNALMQASSSVLNEANLRLESIKGETSRVFDDNLKDFTKFYEDLTGKAAQSMGIASNKDALIAEMSQSVTASFSELEFSWKQSPISPVQDLTTCNPIDTVIQTADFSVASCISELSAAAAAVRKEWFAISAKYVEALASACESEIKRSRETHDIHFKAYTKEAIAKDVPRVIGAALAISEQKLENAYRKVVEEASVQEEMWVKAQLEALESSKSGEEDVKAKELDGIKAALISAVQSINKAAENNEER